MDSLILLGQVTLPDTGVDLAGIGTAVITGVGAIVAVIAGGVGAFKLVGIGLSWLGSLRGK